jgi:GNAT superfamily N-acetyltransferase
MEYSIRRATPADSVILAHHRRAMFEDMGTRDAAELTRVQNDFEPWVWQRLTDGTYQAWVAVNADDQVMGGAGLWLMDWPPTVVSRTRQRGNLFNVYTKPEHRRKGIARALTKTILQWCATHDVDCVILHASADGRPLYESLGFRSTNEMRLQLQRQSPASNSNGE